MAKVGFMDENSKNSGHFFTSFSKKKRIQILIGLITLFLITPLIIYTNCGTSKIAFYNPTDGIPKSWENAPILPDEIPVESDNGRVHGVAIKTTGYGPKANLDCPNQQSPNSIYIDSNYSGSSDGTFAKPFKNLVPLTSTNTPPGTKVCIKKDSKIRVLANDLGFYRDGTSSQPITITSYGASGNPPEFMGSRAITGWTRHNSTIYKKVGVGIPSDEKIEYLTFNRKYMEKARYPKSTDNEPWLYKESNRGDPNADSSGKPLNANGYFVKYLGLSNLLQNLGNPNLVDSQIVIKETNWSILPEKITSINTSTNKIFFNSFTDYGMPTPEQIYYEFYYYKFGFYLTENLAFLTQPGDWYYNKSTDTLYFRAPDDVDPASGSVEVTTISPKMLSYDPAQPGVGFNFYNNHDITIQNMRFSGFAFGAIVCNQTNNIIVQNNEFINSGRSLRNWEDVGTKFLNNVVKDIYIEGLLTIGSKSLEVGNNIFQNVGDKPGTSYSNWTYFGMNVSSQNSSPSTPYSVHDNVVLDSGYIAISAYGPGSIKNNYVQNPMTMLNDGGGIAFDSNDIAAGNMIIENNIVNGCYSNLSGSALGPEYYNYSPLCFGIYHGNRQLNNVKTRYNTVVNAVIAFTIDHSHTSLNSNGMDPHGPTRGHEVYQNTFFGFTRMGGDHTDYSTYSYTVGNPGLVNRSDADWFFNANYNDQVYNNIFYAGAADATMQSTEHIYSDGTKDTTTGLLRKTNFFGTIGSVTGKSDYNSYYNPYGLNTFFKVHCEFSDYNGINSCGPQGHNGDAFITFSQWKSAASLSNPFGGYQDRNSTFTTGSGASGLAPPAERGVIYFNNSNQPKTFALGNCLYQLDGNPSPPSITLAPFASKIFERKASCD